MTIVFSRDRRKQVGGLFPIPPVEYSHAHLGECIWEKEFWRDLLGNGSRHGWRLCLFSRFIFPRPLHLFPGAPPRLCLCGSVLFFRVRSHLVDHFLSNARFCAHRSFPYHADVIRSFYSQNTNQQPPALAEPANERIEREKSSKTPFTRPLFDTVGKTTYVDYRNRNCTILPDGCEQGNHRWKSNGGDNVGSHKTGSR
jgi:hypothetical protein